MDVELKPYPHVDFRDTSDPTAWGQSQEQLMREKVIAIERVKLLRQRVIDCYRREGVNHYQNCKDVAQKYAATIRADGWGMPPPPSS
ncbi:unnamed protein product [Phaeothamnion confervicola]